MQWVLYSWSLLGIMTSLGPSHGQKDKHLKAQDMIGLPQDKKDICIPDSTVEEERLLHL